MYMLYVYLYMYICISIRCFYVNNRIQSLNTFFFENPRVHHRPVKELLYVSRTLLAFLA